jgi:hypothetical protein
LVAAYHDYRKAQEWAPDLKPAGLELARFQVNRGSFGLDVKRKSKDHRGHFEISLLG